MHQHVNLPSRVINTFVCFIKFNSLCIRSIIVLIPIPLRYEIKNKHLWPYTKYNNICLNYKQHRWPKLSSPYVAYNIVHYGRILLKIKPSTIESMTVE